MRRFRADKPEFFAFQIEDSEKVYKIPLAQYIPFPVLKLIDEGFKGQYELMMKYMGDDIEDIPSGMVSDIIKAWDDASKDQGASPGESEALSE